jgi:hypothetical protein
MNEKFYDPIVAEVRKNREEMLAEFDGDTKKLTAHLRTMRPEMEAAGLRFETEAERQVRFAWSQQQQEIVERKIANA